MVFEAEQLHNYNDYAQLFSLMLTFFQQTVVKKKKKKTFDIFILTTIIQYCVYVCLSVYVCVCL